MRTKRFIARMVPALLIVGALTGCHRAKKVIAGSAFLDAIVAPYTFVSGLLQGLSQQMEKGQ